MKIEGVPEGYELVRIGGGLPGERIVGADGTVCTLGTAALNKNYVIIRKLAPTTRPMTRDEFLAAWKQRAYCPLVGKDNGIAYAVSVVMPERIELCCGHVLAFTIGHLELYTFASDGSPLTVTE